ncbi:unnamed protein product [Linum trigynum]|uniref:Uncharacterized protein n=1 Tax=Linum trigynum TaxID=586398 RepID=A0AAV2ET55_9ROSI
MVFLMETKQTSEENESLRNEMGFEKGESWPMDNSGGGRAGGLSVWWKEEINATAMSGSLHHIDMKIVEGTDEVWRFTGVYGWPEGSDKEQMWDLIRKLSNQWEGAWLCGGDLNQVLTAAEKAGGRAPVERDMQAFRDCLLDAQLSDLGYTGYDFTWENKRATEGYIEERLDRFVATAAWQHMFRQGRVLHLDKLRSDHRPIVCDTHGDDDIDPKWGWSFKFEPMWVKHENCEKVVAEAWGMAGEADALCKLNVVRE